MKRKTTTCINDTFFNNQSHLSHSFRDFSRRAVRAAQWRSNPCEALGNESVILDKTTPWWQTPALLRAESSVKVNYFRINKALYVCIHVAASTSFWALILVFILNSIKENIYSTCALFDSLFSVYFHNKSHRVYSLLTIVKIQRWVDRFFFTLKI